MPAPRERIGESPVGQPVLATKSSLRYQGQIVHRNEEIEKLEKTEAEK